MIDRMCTKTSVEVMFAEFVIPASNVLNNEKIFKKKSAVNINTNSC